jgi:hypothetical protein
MQAQSLTLYWLIVACEAGFWIVLVAALAARYSFRSDNLSRALLPSLPVIDILLLTFTALNLKTGNGNCRQPAPGAQRQQVWVRRHSANAACRLTTPAPICLRLALDASV